MGCEHSLSKKPIDYSKTPKIHITYCGKSGYDNNFKTVNCYFIFKIFINYRLQVKLQNCTQKPKLLLPEKTKKLKILILLLMVI